MGGDRVASDDGREVEFRHARQGMAPRVVPQRTAMIAMLVGAMTGAGGSAGAAHFVFKAAVQQEIALHNQSADAHIGLIRTLDAAKASDAENAQTISRLTVQIDGLQRDVRDLRETIVELKTVLKGRR